MTYIILHGELLEAFQEKGRMSSCKLILHILLTCKVPYSLKIQVKGIKGTNVKRKRQRDQWRQSRQWAHKPVVCPLEELP